MCFSRYSTRIVANVAEVDKFARNEFATIYTNNNINNNNINYYYVWLLSNWPHTWLH